MCTLNMDFIGKSVHFFTFRSFRKLAPIVYHAFYQGVRRRSNFENATKSYMVLSKVLDCDEGVCQELFDACDTEWSELGELAGINEILSMSDCMTSDSEFELPGRGRK